MTHPLYRLPGPTAWAAPPNSYSYSSLTAIERCPRQWQLAHSRYGDPARFPTRPHPAAVEGEIVHAVLDRLFKALAVRGMPALKTASFREGLADVDVQRSVRNLIVEHERRLADHPRASAFRLRASPQQLVNQVTSRPLPGVPQGGPRHDNPGGRLPPFLVTSRPLPGVPQGGRLFLLGPLGLSIRGQTEGHPLFADEPEVMRDVLDLGH